MGLTGRKYPSIPLPYRPLHQAASNTQSVTGMPWLLQVPVPFLFRCPVLKTANLLLRATGFHQGLGAHGSAGAASTAAGSGHLDGPLLMLTPCVSHLVRHTTLNLLCNKMNLRELTKSCSHQHVSEDCVNPIAENVHVYAHTCQH